jgi:serine/threonine-protein kinase PknK
VSRGSPTIRAVSTTPPPPSGPGGPRPDPGELGIEGITDPVEIGRGGFGVVYRARQPALHRTVAVKLVATGVLDDRARDRFERELHAMGTLSGHPNIVTIYDSGFTSDGRPFIVMDHMAGGSVADRLARGLLPWQEAATVGVKVAAALETAHRAGVLHRDIKPENILISSYGEAKLGDFGIARVQGGPETRTGIVTASMSHASPEILSGGRPSIGSDVYALGSTLFTMLAGSPAFFRDTDESLVPMITRIAIDPVPDLRSRGVPDDVCRVIERAMAKEPGDRFPSAAALGRALQDAQRRAGVTPTELLISNEGVESRPDPAGVTTSLPPASPAWAQPSGPTPPLPPLPGPSTSGPVSAGPPPAPSSSGPVPVSPAWAQPSAPPPPATQPGAPPPPPSWPPTPGPSWPPAPGQPSWPSAPEPPTAYTPPPPSGAAPPPAVPPSGYTTGPPPGSPARKGRGKVVAVVAAIVVVVGAVVGIVLASGGDDDGSGQTTTRESTRRTIDRSQTTDEEETTTESFEDTTVSLDTSTSTDDTLAPDAVSVFSLFVGLCFDDPTGGEGTVSVVYERSCTDLHDGEVFGFYDFPESLGDPYPGDAVVTESSTKECRDQFLFYTGVDLDTAPYTLFWLSPNAESWANGDREVACYVKDANAETGAKLTAPIIQ